MLKHFFLAGAALAVLYGCGSGGGGSPNPNGGFSVPEAVTGLTTPTAVAFAPDGRIFVCEQGGVLKIAQPGNPNAAAALTLSVASNDENGLLGVAVDPNFAANQFIYLYYTANAGSLNPPPSRANRVSRFTVTGNTVNKNSEQILVDGASASGAHSGGCIRFGPDGRLYVAIGDSGNSANSQTLSNLNGKILRINKDGSVPTDNPFVGTTGARPEIFCLGLRNPFRFGFRPATGAMYIGDVGTNKFEEINVGVRGGNYGWPNFEGPGGAPQFIDPVFSYDHSVGGTVIGGAFVSSGNYPAAYHGAYVIADFIADTATRLTVGANETIQSSTAFGPAEGIPGFAVKIVDIVEGPDGDLYFVSYTQGKVLRLRLQ